jgi:hypothetical protein
VRNPDYWKKGSRILTASSTAHGQPLDARPRLIAGEFDLHIPK